MNKPHVILTMFLIFIFNNIVYSEPAAIPKNNEKESILKVFQTAIIINEDFKRSFNKISFSEYQKKRENLEKYHEEFLLSKLNDCVKILSIKSDYELSELLFQLIVSFQNTADEQFAFSMGEIFYHNPEIVIATITKFIKHEKQFLYKSLEWGWENYISNKNFPNDILTDRYKKLNNLNLYLQE